ncbi:MAG: hypothetical protein K2H19_09145 [Ruminococcus sp.]|nr:hypothetical protein [Ruminococcus sp.]
MYRDKEIGAEKSENKNCLIADTRIIDVPSDDENKKRRLYLTILSDAESGAAVVHNISEKPVTPSTISTLMHEAMRFGKPEHIYVDRRYNFATSDSNSCIVCLKKRICNLGGK